MFIKDIPNSKLNAFHLNVVYFQSDGKGTLRISSFVFSPLNCVFFFSYHTSRLLISFVVLRYAVCIEQGYPLRGKMGNRNVLNKNFVWIVT